MAVALLGAGSAAAQDTSAAGTENPAAVSGIVVTANKRAQSINDVPLTITAAKGETLIARGISSTADLAKIVPGLTAQPSPFNTPVYTLRGVGFYESTLSAAPTVAVYTDEVPLPFSAMTKAAALDLERVEVLKGPQGTLFGENTTGGAINYIAAKPTNHFAAGLDGSYGRFNAVDLQGFVSGPLTDTLKGRFAARVNTADDWQYSITRNDRLGATRQYQARTLLEWKPTDRLHVGLNINGWYDNSDSQAPQRIATYLSVPGNPLGPPLLSYPYPPHTARAADWSADFPPLRHHDWFVQGAVRVDDELSHSLTLTSITAYERYKTKSFEDYDGTALHVSDVESLGRINTFSQELRIAGKASHLNWVVGGNYERDDTFDQISYDFGDSTVSVVGPQQMTYVTNFTDQRIRSAAAFGNVEYEVLRGLKLQAGARYTDTRRSFRGCTHDNAGYGAAQVFDLLETLFRDPSLPFVPVTPNACVTLDASYAPIIQPLQSQLNQDNISWRAGANYRTPNRGLVYVTVSKGYKAGSFPTTAASTTAQYAPVSQESILAYEVGFKQPLPWAPVQINGALFYYDYKDKQLRGRLLDPVFGPIDSLVQVPKSRVWGAEGEINARPIHGLSLDLAATYLDTRIERFAGFNNAGQLQDFAGSRYPYAPKLQLVADGQYEWRLNSRLGAYVGTDLTCNSATSGSIGDIPELQIRGYALLDLRAGIKSADDRWRVELWGRNVTNTYYWTNALQADDVYLRFTGRPATFGVAVHARFG